MKFLLLFTLFVQFAGLAHATHRLPLSQRTAVMQGSVSEPAKPVASHAWKFTLLGLAGLGFLIRKRL